MRKLIMIAWLPWSGKTTIANKLSKHFTENKIDHTLLSIDYLYFSFIKEFFPYLYWMEINNNIQEHYKKLENSIGKDFEYYVLKKIREWKWHIIIDGRHIELMGYRIKKKFMKEFEVHEIFMDKEKPLIQIWLSVPRDRYFYKVVLQKIMMTKNIW